MSKLGQLANLRFKPTLEVLTIQLSPGQHPLCKAAVVAVAITAKEMSTIVVKALK